MVRIFGHLRISCICLHVTTSPSITFWAISGYPPYIGWAVPKNEVFPDRTLAQKFFMISNSSTRSIGRL